LESELLSTINSMLESQPSPISTENVTVTID